MTALPATARKTAYVAALAMTALVVGCVTRRPILGRDINPEQVRRVQPGVTARYEISEWFGPPDSVLNYPDGSQDYRYAYTGWRDRRLRLILYTRTTTQKEHKSLSIRLRHGLVTHVRYSNSTRPRENLSR